MSNYINIELNTSFARIVRSELILKTFENFCKHNSFKQFNYYLHEYPFGRVVSYVLNKINYDSSYAYQHGPASKRKLLCYLSKHENNYNRTDFLKNVPLPKNFYVEDNYSNNIYSGSKIENIIEMKTIQRLSYISNINIKKNSDKVLIVPGLHDGEFLLEILKDDIIKRKNKLFFFKPHPRSNLNPSIYKNFQNLIISNEHIAELLSNVSKVICTYSSVAIEANILGIDVELINIPGKINLSPLIDDEFKKIIPNLRDKLKI